MGVRVDSLKDAGWLTPVQYADSIQRHVSQVTRQWLWLESQGASLRQGPTQKSMVGDEKFLRLHFCCWRVTHAFYHSQLHQLPDVTGLNSRTFKKLTRSDDSDVIILTH
jgi:hypothetical protein